MLLGPMAHPKLMHNPTACCVNTCKVSCHMMSGSHWPSTFWCPLARSLSQGRESSPATVQPLLLWPSCSQSLTGPLGK